MKLTTREVNRLSKVHVDYWGRLRIIYNNDNNNKPFAKYLPYAKHHTNHINGIISFNSQQSKMGFPDGASGKESTYQCRRLKRPRFNPWVGKIPGRKIQQPTSVFLLGESHGQRSLVGYNPQVCTQSQTGLKWLSTDAHKDVKSRGQVSLLRHDKARNQAQVEALNS